MIISSSSVSMSSKRDYHRFEERKSVSISEKKGESVVLDLSEDAKGLSEQLTEYKEAKEQQQKELAKERQQKATENLKEFLQKHQQKVEKQKNEEERIKSKEEMELEMLKRLLSALKKRSGNHEELSREIKEIQSEFRSSSSIFSKQTSIHLEGTSSKALSTVVSNEPSYWTRTTVTSSFVTEAEHTAFQATGVARTADGREIDFGVTVEMSRAFCAKYESLVQEDYLVTDPLVINLDSNVAHVSDMKFMFDIDADGKEDEVSLADRGSGFLALDRNQDGIINDGLELFGTKSGDGFADLAAYDEDGNGWIDEADGVFDDLKIWTKAEDGSDILLNLKEADVGAIYLGNASTEFSLNELETNQTNGIIRKTGVYLKESGGVGTVQHVDLTV